MAALHFFCVKLSPSSGFQIPNQKLRSVCLDDRSAEIEDGIINRSRIVTVEGAVVVVATAQRSPNRIDPHLRTRVKDTTDRFLNLVI